MLLIYRLQPFGFGGLPSHVVRRNHPSSVTRVAVEQGRAPSAQAAEVICLMLHVSHQLPTRKCGCSPRLIMSNSLVFVVSRVCADVWNVVAKPSPQICRARIRGPVNAHLGESSTLNLKFLTYTYQIPGFPETCFCGSGTVHLTTQETENAVRPDPGDSA